MEPTLRAAVVAGPPLVRHGLALQLRLAGVVIVGEPDRLASLQPLDRVDAVLLVTDPRRDVVGVRDLLARSVDVVALVDDPAEVGYLPAAPSVGVPGAPRGPHHGRLTVLPFAEVGDVHTLLARLRGESDRRPGARAVLTPTERAVHALLGQGYSNTGIARVLSLSPKTVEGCVSSVFDKLGLLDGDPGRNRRVAAALTWVAAAP